MKQVNACPLCGGELRKCGDHYECLHCGAIFEEEKVYDLKEELSALLDDLKQEKVANLRSLLWEATHEKYQSKDKINKICHELRNYLPDDFLACFYETVNTKSIEEINDYLRAIDYRRNNYNIDLVVEYMLKVTEVGNLLALNNLIEDVYKKSDLLKYNDYSTRLSKIAEELEEGIYELSISREVFIAYSSKDMKYVEEVAKALDENGISYFVAMKNLRHGKGAAENYDKALEEAMDNSHILLFISSPNSRSLACDALKKELPYIKKKDLEYAPSEYRHSYSKLPMKYKKPRVQLLIGETPKGTPADNLVAEIFDGFEWRYDVDSVVSTIFSIITSEPVEEISESDKLRLELEELKKTISSRNNNVEKPKAKVKDEIIRREGNDVYFGSYYQTNNSDKEPIKWNILAEENGKALVISEKILHGMSYGNRAYNYKDSNARKWLINDFFNEAFKDEEKNMMISTTLSDSGNVSDKLFLLSEKEAKKYYADDNKRIAQGTNVAKRKLYVYSGNSCWWLRTPGETSSFMDTRVRDVLVEGNIKDITTLDPQSGIRPACWVIIDKELYEQSGEAEPKELFRREGNELYFGSYYQVSGKPKSDIKWNILEEKDGKALIITEKIIDTVMFDFEKNNYEKSYIRKWLNGDFLKEAFSKGQQDLIETTLVDNSLASTKDDKNPYICNNTNDKVFLLSTAEVMKYLQSNKLRIVKGTEYALDNGLYESFNQVSPWWLRTPHNGSIDETSKIVSNYGTLETNGVEKEDTGVRPALWINLSKSKAINNNASNKKTASGNAKYYRREGNDIYFGSYSINEEGIKEPIKWKVLKEENGTALLLSEKVLKVIMFDNGGAGNVYKDSMIREWLTEDFFEDAFSDQEKAIINDTSVRNDVESTGFDENEFVSENTLDKVFLLSRQEVEEYLYNKNQSCIAEATEYAAEKGFLPGRSCGWWLRSPSNEDFYAQFINYDGGFDEDFIDSFEIGARPAIVIKL